MSSYDAGIRWSMLIGTVVAVICVAGRYGGAAPRGQGAAERAPLSRKSYSRPAADKLRQALTPRQYEVTQNAEPEPPFRNAYWDNHDAGLYVDVATGEPLFSSTD